MVDPIACARCLAPLNNGEGHCGSDKCPRCWAEGVNEDRETYPKTEDYE